jgi:hypothetical protein
VIPWATLAVHLDCHLLEADRGLQGTLVGRMKPVHQRLLVLLDRLAAPGPGDE